MCDYCVIALLIHLKINCSKPGYCKSAPLRKQHLHIIRGLILECGEGNTHRRTGDCFEEEEKLVRSPQFSEESKGSYMMAVFKDVESVTISIS